MTSRRLGTSLSASAPVESKMRLPSNLKPGISIGREPVAMTMPFCASMPTVLPSAPLTSTRFLPVTVAVPSTSCVPAALMSCLTPPVSLPTISPFHFCVCTQSSFGSATMPIGLRLDEVELLGRLNERLRRDAADVEADAADVTLLDDDTS